MKLVRFGPAGAERPGVWVDGAFGPGRPGLLDVRAMAFDLADYDRLFFERHGPERLQGLLSEKHRVLLPAGGVRLGPPVARPGQVVCLGKNYADHVAEFDARRPERPVLFAKAPAAVIGPNDPILLPAGARVDIEVELAVVLGKTARRVDERRAMECVAGYTLLDDVTDRDAQREDGQWFRAKSRDTFCPMGPFLVTPDELGDPYARTLRSSIDGRPLQAARAADMLFRIAHVIAYASESFTLHPGDVLSTGTPGGIGSARTPPVLLNPGSVAEVSIEGLGAQRNEARAS